MIIPWLQKIPKPLTLKTFSLKRSANVWFREFPKPQVMLKNEVLRVLWGYRMYFGKIHLNSKLLRRDFFLLSEFNPCRSYFSRRKWSKFAFQADIYLSRIFKLLNWYKISRCWEKMRKRMIVDPLRSKSWEKLNSGRKRNNRLNFVPNFDVKSVGNGSKLAFSAENWTLEYPSAF